MTLLAQRLADTPLAVIDLETTGLSATSDGIVEIAIVRIDPGEAPRLVLDTLVDPQRRVSCSEIHGIYDEDVEGAPLLDELAQPIADAIDGAMVASFNVYFDIKFIDAGLQHRLPIPLPHLCLMWLRPALGLGDRATLGRTCSAMGVPLTACHRAASDAMASAQLWAHYLRGAESLQINTFEDLAKRKQYKFIKSWDREVLRRDALSLRPLGTALKPRVVRTEQERQQVRRRERGQVSGSGVAMYWDAMLSAIVDGELSTHEVNSLRGLQAMLDVTPDQLRYVHGRIVSGLLDQMTSDTRIDDDEAAWLAHVMQVLRGLGWAPGDGAPEATDQRVRSLQPETVPMVEPVRGSWWSRVFG